MFAESCVEDSDHVDEQTKNLLSVFPIRTKDGQARMLTHTKKCRLQQLLTCPICLALFRDPVSIKECSHRFCKECIEKYIRYQQNKSCPICRKRIGSKRQLRIDEALQSFMKSIFGSLELTYQQEEKKFQQDLENTVKFQNSKKQTNEQSSNIVTNKNYLINIQLIAQNQLISQVPLSNLRVPGAITLGYISELLSDYLCQSLEISPYLDFYIGDHKLNNDSTLMFLNDEFWQIYSDQSAYDPDDIKWTAYVNTIPQRIIHYNADRILQSIQ